jgi:hypothetical protein
MNHPIRSRAELNTRRGSEQCQATNTRIAWSVGTGADGVLHNDR